MVLVLVASLLGVATAQSKPDRFAMNLSRLNNAMAQIEVTCEVGTPKVNLGNGKIVNKRSFAHKFEIGTYNITASCGIRTDSRKFVSAGDSWPAAGQKSGTLSVKVVKGVTAEAQFTVIGSCEPFELSWGDTSEPLQFEGIEVGTPGATCLTDVTIKKAKHTYKRNGQYQLTLKAGNRTTSATVQITQVPKQ